MARYQIILAYDGTEFSGFQRQRKASGRTVQVVIENALRKIGWQGRTILAAGRTDSGVHASGQVVAFDLDWKNSEADLCSALNANLPFDVAVISAKLVEADFHPRYDASFRHYRYQICMQPMRDPLRERYYWRVWPQPDLAKLSAAADIFAGVHDFGAFGKAPRLGGSTVREIFLAKWQQHQDELSFDIYGNAFLFRMIRRLVKMQVNIGQGKWDIEILQQWLHTGEVALNIGLAPACGLNLIEVGYKDGHFIVPAISKEVTV